MDMQAGWLDDFSAWIWALVQLVWKAFTDFMNDLFVTLVDQVCSMVLYVLNLLPVPSFMQGHTIGEFLGQAGSTILWFAYVFQIGPCLVVLGSAMTFYVLRRILTLGIW